MKDVHVRFAGIEKAPDSEQLSVIYIPDNRQILLPGRRYRIIIEGLSFEKWEGTREFKHGPESIRDQQVR